MPERRDDSMMSRFDDQRLRSYRARDAIAAILITAALLIVIAGDAVPKAAERLPAGVGRDVVEAVGEPTAWVADGLPFAQIEGELTGGLSPDPELIGAGFGAPAAGGTGGRVAPITPDAFDPLELGVDDPAPGELETVLVTGDSMSALLDVEMARRLTDEGIEVIGDPHLGSGITRPDIVDWARLSTTQVAEHEPDAVVVFLGAGDNYPLPDASGDEVSCCGPEWAALYATRVRQMMDTYRQGGDARVYWLNIPTPRSADRAEYTRAVNAAIEVAAEPWRSQVRIMNLLAIFTPDGRYKASLEIDGEERIVRASDGLHLTEIGAEVATDVVLERIEIDFDR